MVNDPKTNPGGDGETVDVTAASGGQKTGHMRWVLGLSTAAVIIGMIVIWFVARAGR